MGTKTVYIFNGTKLKTIICIILSDGVIDIKYCDVHCIRYVIRFSRNGKHINFCYIYVASYIYAHFTVCLKFILPLVSVYQ